MLTDTGQITPATGPRATEDDIETSRDAFLGGAVYVQQPRHGYRAGLDAVLLAASVPSSVPGRQQRLLDVGSGVGVVGLCAAARLPLIDVTLVEQSRELCALAARNITDNNLEGRARVVEQDVSRPVPHQHLHDNGFDVVVSNPPFYDATRHRQSPHALKAASHAMPDAGLDSWLRYMARMAKAGGTAIVIHRADQLSALLAGFAPRFGGITVVPLHPRAGDPASRVIVGGTKGSRAPMSLRPGICLHGPDNRFTPEIDKVLKTPSPLEL